MADPNAFAKLIPGFDFMQGLIKSAGSGLPGVSQWIAPTLDPEELENASATCAPCSSGSSRTPRCWARRSRRWRCSA